MSYHTLGTAVMRTFPIRFSKVMISTMASGSRSSKAATSSDVLAPGGSRRKSSAFSYVNNLRRILICIRISIAGNPLASSSTLSEPLLHSIHI